MKKNNDIIIRNSLEEDQEQIVLIYNHYIANTAYNFELRTYTLSKRKPWFQQFVDNHHLQLLVAVNSSNSVLGYLATTPFSAIEGYNTSANISIYCPPENMGSGIGSSLLSYFLKLPAVKMYHKLYAGITVPNIPSKKLFEKFNFTHVARFDEVGYKFNRYWDVEYLCLNIT